MRSHLKLLLVPLLALSFGLVVVVGQTPDSHGFDVSGMDRSVSPCVDFYQFANGAWVKKNPIPAAFPSWGRFDELQAKNEDNLRALAEEAAKSKDAPQGSIERKIGDFYASAMDEAQIESAGLKPLAEDFARIERIKSLRDLQDVIARLHGYNEEQSSSPIFHFGSTQDFKNSTQVIGEADQGGLGLPDRDYYTKTDADSRRIRAEYLKHVAKMFELMGDSAAKAKAEALAVMSIETRLARVSLTQVERRDPANVYHKMTVAQLQSLAPNFEWAEYFRAVGAPALSEVNVTYPAFFKHASLLLKTVSLSDWKTYLRWHLIDDAAEYLPKKFVDQNFAFMRVLLGTEENLPRWKRSVRETDSALGESLGQLYVQKFFPPEAKASALAMVRNMEAALKADISTLQWMGPETRKAADAKLEAFADKIGYPERWRDYAALEVDRGPYVLNALRAVQFENRRSLAKIGQPVDRLEWEMSPPTVNAYYSAQKNEIVFPAGILQPPFYDPAVDDAINYGGIGAVIGHEMSHGFDDQGAKFDPQGNMRNWWSEQDLKNFNSRAECIVKQFDAYPGVGEQHHNGKLVVGESIADLGGLLIAYAALEKSIEGKPRPADVDGFTPEQRFFLGWAQVWAENNRPEYARLRLNVDPHPLGSYRANGPLSNMPAFARAFGCKAGDPMVRAEKDRCQIW